MNDIYTLTEKQIKTISSFFEVPSLVEKESLSNYSHDQTEDLIYYPGIVVFPKDTNEIANLLRYCNNERIPVTPVGARTGLSGGALPVHGGVMLSTEKLNKILKIDTDNLQVHTQPGVITYELQQAVKEHGLFYPPDPASSGSCFIGGNIAENSGGPKAVKYGVTSDYVLNLEVVLANGEIIQTGANVLKNSTGYNLTQLIVGSEGTLGIVTKIILKLIPHPTLTKLMLIPFHKIEDACAAVSEIFKAGITPSGMEFMERDAIIYTLENFPEITLEVKEQHQAHLLVEVDGFNEDVLINDCEKILEVVEKFDIDEVLFAESEAQKNELWSIRRKVGEAVKAFSIYKEEDTVVPRYHLPELIVGVKKIGQKYNFKSVCYGHAGDGNLHINILKGDLDDHFWENTLSQAIREIFELTVSLGGTISGEHGIGLVQKNYMDIPFKKAELELMQSIKKVFDPNNILNPGKIFPDESGN
jgi:glycolate oxidase